MRVIKSVKSKITTIERGDCSNNKGQAQKTCPRFLKRWPKGN